MVLAFPLIHTTIRYVLSNISRLLQKFQFPIDEVVLNFCKLKWVWNRFSGPSFCGFFDKFFLLSCDLNWSNFINILRFLPKFFRKMYFLFCAWAFDDVVKSKNFKIWFSRERKEVLK